MIKSFTGAFCLYFTIRFIFWVITVLFVVPWSPEPPRMQGALYIYFFSLGGGTYVSALSMDCIGPKMSFNLGWLTTVSQWRMTLGNFARRDTSRSTMAARLMTEATLISASVMRSPTRKVRVERCASRVLRARIWRSMKVLWILKGRIQYLGVR